MKLTFKIENPLCEISINDSLFDVKKFFKDFPLKQVIQDEYIVVPQVVSLAGVKHDLGLHFLSQRLVKMELFSFDLEHIDTDDEFQYIQDQLVKIYGNPTTSALQDGMYHQNQWIIGDFEITNNQTAERGLAIYLGSFSGFTLTSDGLWKPRS